MNKRANRVLVLVCLAPVFFIPGCSRYRIIRTDPFYESFLEKTSLIMTEEEIDIYSHLPDEGAKAAFIEDFWKIRDPIPGTLENENKMEFERRVAFANEWFGNPGGSCLRRAGFGKSESGWGWNTDKGVAYIVIGPPDLVGIRDFQEAWEGIEPEDGYRLCLSDKWFYVRLKLPLFFRNDLSSYDPEETLPEAAEPQIRTLSANTDKMEQAKMEWVAIEYRQSRAVPLRFKASYKNENLTIRIPIQSVSFRASDDGTLTAKFDVEIRVYCDRRKLDSLQKSQAYLFTQSEAEALSRLEIAIPYVPPRKGRYLFDIVVTSDDPSAVGRCRNYVKARISTLAREM